VNFPDALFPQSWALGAAFPLLLAWHWCIRTAPWKRLADSGQSNVWLGTVVLLALVWSMKAGVKPGLNLHLLGATMFTLMFGRQLAIIGLSLVLGAVTLNWDLQGHPGWTAYALNALVLAVFPPLLADAIRRGMERWLPLNFFIYVFVAAFFGAAAHRDRHRRPRFHAALAGGCLSRGSAARRLPALLRIAGLCRSLAQWRDGDHHGGVPAALGRQFRRPALYSEQMTTE
jgi:hypothetical protein